MIFIIFNLYTKLTNKKSYIYVVIRWPYFIYFNCIYSSYYKSFVDNSFFVKTYKFMPFMLNILADIQIF